MKLTGDDTKTVDQLVTQLRLEPHQEGGFFREIYRHPAAVDDITLARQMGTPFAGNRNLMTAIYFLLPAGTYSALHRIKADELWLHLAGGPLKVHEIDEDGQWQTTVLDRTTPQLHHLVPRGRWFGSEPAGAAWSLVSCLCAPGFDFADFEMAGPQLLAQFPALRSQLAPLLRP